MLGPLQLSNGGAGGGGRSGEEGGGKKLSGLLSEPVLDDEMSKRRGSTLGALVNIWCAGAGIWRPSRWCGRRRRR